MNELDEILDSLFHGAALAAFVEEACIAKDFPCPIKTRKRAYRYFEDALAEKNAGHSVQSSRSSNHRARINCESC